MKKFYLLKKLKYLTRAAQKESRDFVAIRFCLRKCLVVIKTKVSENATSRKGNGGWKRLINNHIFESITVMEFHETRKIQIFSN